jgi:hypothetical protein
MTEESPSQHKTLADWEQSLGPQVRQVELLGELGITAQQCTELGDALSKRLRALGPTAIWRVVRRDYPCSFAVYLVAEGVYGYQGGDYWGQVCRITGFSQPHSALLGRLFLRILQDFELPVFPDMPGHVYVATILAHGGIPNYCLPDFFERVLQRAVSRPEYLDITATELAEDLQSSSAHYVIDKPVLRFLQYGGEVAEDFFNRCRDMARDYLETDMVSSVEEIGLPRRVVEAYEQWMTEQEDKTPPIRVPSKDRLGLRKPDIVLDPWGDGVSLLLHPQRVPVSLSGANLSWLVKTDQAQSAVPVRARRFGGDLQTTAESLPLRKPSSVYEVSFQANEEQKRTWRYSGPDEDHPLLVFRADSGTVVSSRRSLPAATLWLVVREDLEPQFDGRVECLEEFPRLPGLWAEYRVQCWDLSGATSFSLLHDKDSIVRLIVRPDETMLRPHYVGGELLSAGQSDSSALIPTYSGALPSIRVPRTGRRALEEGLSRWRLWLCADGPSNPQIDTKLVLTHLLQHLRVDERYVDVPLEARDLLGSRAVGTFSVRIRGPMGRRADLPVRILRPMEIMGHERLYFPDTDDGPPPVTLEVRVGGTTTVECQPEAEGCEVLRVYDEPDKSRRFVIRASPETGSADLDIITNVSAQQSVHIPLSVPIRRLRWALLGEQEDLGPTEWSARVIGRTAHTFLQAYAPSLLIDLPGLEDSGDLRLRLCLSDIDGLELQSQEAAPAQRRRRFWRFDLRAYMDTVRFTKSPVLHFELEGLSVLQEGAPSRVPVMSLTQHLLIDDVRLVGQALDNRIRVELKWSEPIPLTHRCLRFWPIHRPWETPYELSIPDEAQGEFTFEAPAPKLHGGKYRLEFLILDPWAVSAYPQRPRIGAPGTVDTELLGIGARLDEIDSLIDELGERFDLLLERAFVLYDAGDESTARQDLEWCFLHLGQGTIPQVLALAEVLSVRSDTDLLEHLRFFMFAPDRVEELVDGRAQGAVSVQQFRAYLAYLPQLDALPAATFLVLLRAQDTALSLRAAGELVRRSATEGLEAILQWTSQGSLSDGDAVDLCRLNPGFAFDFLESKAANSTAHRLLLALSKQELGIVRVVRPGTWIQSNVGWGRIDRIEESSSGLEVEEFIKSKLDHRLEVTLRPEGDAERVTIDLESATITFLQAEAIATCTKCYRFSTAKGNWGLITNQHERAVHGGIGPSLIYEEVTTKALQEWAYSNVAPRNQFA